MLRAEGLEGGTLLKIASKIPWLVNGTYDEVVRCAGKARVRAVCRPSAQLPPESFVENGLTHVLSTLIRDVDQFECDMVNGADMEGAIRELQGMLDISRS